MKSIGIKLADGSFYPLLEEGNPEKKSIDLTTATDGQTKIHVDVYRSDTGTMEGAEYLDTLEMQGLKPHQTGEPTLDLSLDMNEDGQLEAQITDAETGGKSGIQVTLASRGAALPASKANETPFDFDELEGGGTDEPAGAAPSSDSTPQADDTAKATDDGETDTPEQNSTQEDTPAETEGAGDFDMSAIEQLDEPFDFDATLAEDEPTTDEASDGVSADEPVAEDEPTTDDATDEEDAPEAVTVDEGELKSLEELDLDEAGSTDAASTIEEAESADESAPDEAGADGEPLADEFDLGDLSELNLDDTGGSEGDVSTIEESAPAEGLSTDEATSVPEEAPAQESEGAQGTGEGLLSAAEAKKSSWEELDATGEAPAADEASADDFDLGGLEQLGDLGAEDSPDESDEQIMVPDPASLVPEIEDITNNTAAEEEAAEELPTDETEQAADVPQLDQADEAKEVPADEFDLGGLDEPDEAQAADEASADDFDLGGLEQLGDLGAEGSLDESDEQIMVPDPASLVPEIEDITDNTAAEEEPSSETQEEVAEEPAAEDDVIPDAQEAATSESDEPDDETVAQDDEVTQEEVAEELPPVNEEQLADEESPVTDELATDGSEPTDELPADEELSVADELPTDDLASETQIPEDDAAAIAQEISADEEIPVAQEIPTEEAIGAEELPEDELATLAEESPKEELPDLDQADEGSLDELDAADTGGALPAAEAAQGDFSDEFDLGDTGDEGSVPAIEEATEPAEDISAQEAQELPTDEATVLADEAVSDEVLPDEATLPDAEGDTDLGQLNGEPFDFDAAGQTSADEEMPADETQVATETTDADDFGLGELAAMDLGSLAELPDEAAEPETVEAESVDDLQVPGFDDEGASRDVTDFDLPDFDEDTSAQDTAEDFSLPDFDDDMGGDNLDFTGLFDEKSGGKGDKPNDDLIFSDEDFSLPDDFLSDTSEEGKDDIGGSGGLFNGLDKEGLYDKATLEGGSPSYSEDDDVKRKTKAPVVICVICAVICVLAAALMLLAELKPEVLRSTFFSKSESSNMVSLIESVKSESAQGADQKQEAASQNAQEMPTGEETQKESDGLSSSPPPPEVKSTSAAASSQVKTGSAAEGSAASAGARQQAPSTQSVEAREDQIVVATTPEHVVPKAPEPNPQKTADVRYKVVWGDTLWDISNAYYRTPWKFRRIASYNGIKDPDKIIAGTWLLLPAE